MLGINWIRSNIQNLTSHASQNMPQSVTQATQQASQAVQNVDDFFVNAGPNTPGLKQIHAMGQGLNTKAGKIGTDVLVKAGDKLDEAATAASAAAQAGNKVGILGKIAQWGPIRSMTQGFKSAGQAASQIPGWQTAAGVASKGLQYLDSIFKLGQAGVQAAQGDMDKAGHTALRAGGSALGTATVGTWISAAGLALARNGGTVGKVVGIPLTIAGPIIGAWGGDKVATAVGDTLAPRVAEERRIVEGVQQYGQGNPLLSSFSQNQDVLWGASERELMQVVGKGQLSKALFE